MKTVSIFKNGSNQAIRLPKELAFKGVKELEIIKDGDSIILRPLRPSWVSLSQHDKADADFLQERADVIGDEERFTL